MTGFVVHDFICKWLYMFCIVHQSDAPVFVLQAVWTRFFPVSLEISRLLSRGEVGEVKVVRADFGVPLTHVPRTVQKELGGGALLVIGMYCIQFVLMAFNGEKPETVQATGVCLDTGTEATRIQTAEYHRYYSVIQTDLLWETGLLIITNIQSNQTSFRHLQHYQFIHYSLENGNQIWNCVRTNSFW